MAWLSRKPPSIRKISGWAKGAAAALMGAMPRIDSATSGAIAVTAIGSTPPSHQIAISSAAAAVRCPATGRASGVGGASTRSAAASPKMTPPKR